MRKKRTVIKKEHRDPLARAHEHLRRRSPAYHRWHNNPHHITVHWLIFIAFSLGVIMGVWFSIAGIIAQDAAASPNRVAITPLINGAAAGSGIAQGAAIVSFQPKTALEPLDKVAVFFPEGTQFKSDQIAASDFELEQLAPSTNRACLHGAKTPPSQVVVNEITSSLMFTLRPRSLSHGDCAGQNGMGEITIGLSLKSSGQEIVLPVSPNPDASLNIKTSRGDYLTSMFNLE